MVRAAVSPATLLKPDTPARARLGGASTSHRPETAQPARRAPSSVHHHPPTSVQRVAAARRHALQHAGAHAGELLAHRLYVAARRAASDAANAGGHQLAEALAQRAADAAGGGLEQRGGEVERLRDGRVCGQGRRRRVWSE